MLPELRRLELCAQLMPSTLELRLELAIGSLELIDLLPFARECDLARAQPLDELQLQLLLGLARCLRRLGSGALRLVLLPRELLPRRLVLAALAGELLAGHRARRRSCEAWRLPSGARCSACELGGVLSVSGVVVLTTQRRQLIGRES